MKRVLIVEQDEITTDVLSDSVSVLSYQAITLPEGDSLAIALIEVDPEVIIISRKLFVKNRQLFISALNPNERICDAVVIVTSNAILDPDRVKELGAHFFLFKPFDLATLQQVLESASDSISMCG